MIYFSVSNIKTNNEIKELLTTNIQLNIEPIELNELEQLEFTPTFAYQIEKYIKK